MKKLHEEFLDDVDKESLVSDNTVDLQPAFDPTCTFKVNFSVVPIPERKPKLIKTIDFFQYYTNECLFIQQGRVTIYHMEEYDDYRRMKKFELNSRSDRNEFVNALDSILESNNYPFIICIDFVPKYVSLKLFVSQLRMLASFVKAHTGRTDAMYIEFKDCAYTIKWFIQITSFFVSSQIQEVYHNMFPNAQEEKDECQTIINGLSGMFRAKDTYDFVTDLCIIRKYPNLYKGYEVGTDGFIRDVDNIQVFLKVKSNTKQMTVGEALDFWKNNFLFKLSEHDRSLIKNKNSNLTIYVICDNATFKSGNSDNDYIRICSLPDDNNKHYKIIAVDRYLIPYINQYKDKNIENGALMTRTARFKMKSEFKSIFERWRLLY